LPEEGHSLWNQITVHMFLLWHTGAAKRDTERQRETSPDISEWTRVLKLNIFRQCFPQTLHSVVLVKKRKVIYAILNVAWLLVPDWPVWVGECRAQPNVGLNVTQTFYIVSQDQAGCLSALFLLLPEDGLPRICGKFWLYFVTIMEKECFDTMQVHFFIIGFFSVSELGVYISKSNFILP